MYARGAFGARYAACRDEEACGVGGSSYEAGNWSGFSSAQCVAEFGEPFVLVDGLPLVGFELSGGEAEDGARSLGRASPGSHR